MRADVEPDSGGETALPLADAIDEDLQSTKGMSACASRQGISVLPRKVGAGAARQGHGWELLARRWPQ